MTTENYNPQTSDDLERGIVNALRERQRKTRLINEWETADRQTAPKPRRIALRPFVAMAAAACVALLLIFAPWQHDDPTPLDNWMQTEMEASRAAFPGYGDLSRALNAEDYNLALDIVSESIEQSLAQKQIIETQGDDYDDDERDYELRAINRNLEDSRWVKICLLIQMHRIKEARQCLEEYRQNPDYVLHRSEVIHLLNDIKKGNLK